MWDGGLIDQYHSQVMDDGRIVEYDEPGILLQDPNSLLKTMVDRTGPSASRKLYQIAKETFEGRKKGGVDQTK